MNDDEISIGPSWLNFYKRRGQWNRVLYVHGVVAIWRIEMRISRWHELPGSRRDYHVAVGYNNGNDEEILNPSAQWTFHTGNRKEE